MTDHCPHCGGEMLDDTCQERGTSKCTAEGGPCELACHDEGENENLEEEKRCAKCDYWEELIWQDDGTIILKPHMPGGFAAAGGVLAATWDDEKAEDAVRRARGGRR